MLTSAHRAHVGTLPQLPPLLPEPLSVSPPALAVVGVSVGVAVFGEVSGEVPLPTGAQGLRGPEVGGLVGGGVFFVLQAAAFLQKKEGRRKGEKEGRTNHGRESLSRGQAGAAQRAVFVPVLLTASQAVQMEGVLRNEMMKKGTKEKSKPGTAFPPQDDRQTDPEGDLGKESSALLCEIKVKPCNVYCIDNKSCKRTLVSVLVSAQPFGLQGRLHGCLRSIRSLYSTTRKGEE